MEANELYSRGARICKRETAVDASSVAAPTEFLAVKCAIVQETLKEGPFSGRGW